MRRRLEGYIDMELLKKVARGLKYRSIPHIIGQEIEIHSFDTIIDDIFKAQAHSLPAKYEQISRISPMAIAKYGILDLRFEVSPHYLGEGDERGIPLLKALGFIQPPDTNQEPEVSMESIEEKLDPHCLAELSEDIDKQQTLLKLFLTNESVLARYDRERMSPRELKDVLDNLAIPDDYFPRTFVIQDACYTNSNFVWFLKHFYI